MGGYTLPVPQDPNDPNQQYPYASNIYGAGYAYSPYSIGGTGGDPDTSQNGFNPQGNEVDVKAGAAMPQIFDANRDTINTTGNVIGQEGANELGYYGQQQQEYGSAENAALNQLQATPGYTAAQTAAISGNPYAPVTQLEGNVGGEQSTLNSGVQDQNTALNQYGQDASAQLQQTEGWQGGAAQGYASDVGDAASEYGTGVGGAVTGLGTGLEQAQQGFSPLNTAVYNPNLQVSDRDVQNMVTAAGTTVGNQFQTAEDTLERQSAAAGNTSPEAEAAQRQQLVTQEAATAGDTMTQAQIAAQQYQLGALQQQTGEEATAATTEEAAAQAAAGLSGTTGVSAAENTGAANIGAEEQIGANTQAVAGNVSNQALNEANTYGQFDVGQENTQTGQQLGQENTQTGQEYGANSAAEQEASARATTEANQDIAGQTAYRSGVQGEQEAAQQGGATAQQTQLGAYGTQTSGVNSNTASQSNYATGKPSLGDSLGSSLANLFDEGGMVQEPTMAKVAESGPEWVGPANALMKEGVRGRYRRSDEEMPMYGKMAA